ncbi:hypothetical protein KEM52_003880, partial [Ascosphaera acerosa]
MPYASRRSRQRVVLVYLLAFAALCLLLYQHNVTKNTRAHIDGLQRAGQGGRGRQRPLLDGSDGAGGGGLASRPGSQLPKAAVPPSQSGPTAKFSWSAYKEHHSVDRMVPLPADEPRDLPHVQARSFPEPSPRFRAQQHTRQKAVKEAFLRGWSNY